MSIVCPNKRFFKSRFAWAIIFSPPRFRFTYILTLLTLFLVSPLNSQTNWEEYYPLHVGDFWEYDDLDWTGLPTKVTRQVIKDTLMPNGKTYKVIEHFVRDGPYPRKSYEYQRIDTLGNVFTYAFVSCKFPTFWVDTLIYKLNGRVGDSIRAICHTDSTFWIISRSGLVDFFGIRKWTEFYLIKSVLRGVVSIIEGIGMYDYGGEGFDGWLRGAIISGKKYGNITVSVEDNQGEGTISESYQLEIYPNPFNSQTTVRYGLNQSGLVELTIYDLVGRRVRVLFEGYQRAVYHSLVWNGTNARGEIVSTGTYLMALRSNNVIVTRKLLYIK